MDLQKICPYLQIPIHYVEAVKVLKTEHDLDEVEFGYWLRELAVLGDEEEEFSPRAKVKHKVQVVGLYLIGIKLPRKRPSKMSLTDWNALCIPIMKGWLL